MALSAGLPAGYGIEKVIVSSERPAFRGCMGSRIAVTTGPELEVYLAHAVARLFVRLSARTSGTAKPLRYLQ